MIQQKYYILPHQMGEMLKACQGTRKWRENKVL